MNVSRQRTCLARRFRPGVRPRALGAPVALRRLRRAGWTDGDTAPVPACRDTFVFFAGKTCESVGWLPPRPSFARIAGDSRECVATAWAIGDGPPPHRPKPARTAGRAPPTAPTKHQPHLAPQNARRHQKPPLCTAGHQWYNRGPRAFPLRLECPWVQRRRGNGLLPSPPVAARRAWRRRNRKDRPRPHCNKAAWVQVPLDGRRVQVVTRLFRK